MARKPAGVDRLSAIAKGGGIAKEKPAPTVSDKAAPAADLKGLEINPPRGERGEFYKISATLPGELFDLLEDEVRARRKARETGANMSVIVREALSEYFQRKA